MIRKSDLGTSILFIENSPIDINGQCQIRTKGKSTVGVLEVITVDKCENHQSALMSIQLMK